MKSIFEKKEQTISHRSQWIGLDLVRDNIPEILMREGRAVHTRIAKDDQYEFLLLKKLYEEVSEFLRERKIEKFGDIEEIMRAYADHKGMDWESVDSMRKRKVEEAGNFKKKIILERVEE